jgi:choline dehydrogenase-like flavoprotein
MNPSAPEPSPASLRWLSRDYADLRQHWDGKPFDVLIVGSGYGGAMAAAELAGREVLENGKPRPVRVCVLERGQEYAPGMFASSLQDLPPHVRVHRGGHDKTLGSFEGLLDLRLGADVSTLVGNGLGGGSLINAGVMEVPRLDQCERLPRVLREELTPAFFVQVQAQLGASTELGLHPDVPPGGLAKSRGLRELQEAAQAGRAKDDPRHLKFRDAAITVQVRDDAADPDVPRCTLCGDCMTGCNVGAKKSLDTTLLREAWRRGAEIYTGGSVLQVRKLPDGVDGHPEACWSVTTAFTDESLRRRHDVLPLLARRLILAAGTLGSTEILLRSRSRKLPLSQKLGEQFSCNGDNLVALHDGPKKTDTTTDEHVPLRDRRVGPTITSVIELGDMLLQEFAVPAPLKRLFEETVTTARLLNDLGKPPTHSGSSPSGCDSFGVDGDAMDKTLLVGLIGHDESCGQLQLADAVRMDDSRHLEGRVRIQWPHLRKSYLLDRGFDTAKQLVEEARGAGASVLPNPLWRLLPQDMEFLVKDQRGPVLTVHPLGGCPIGESHLHGVVDDRGRVYDPQASEAARGTRFHDGLVVLDGSIIPASLGANPALTIAAVAKRAAGLLATEWGFAAGGSAPPRALRRRPVLRKPEHCTPAKPKETEVELAERLIGKAGPHLVELTLRYRPATVAAMMSGRRPKMALDPRRSFLRVYDGGDQELARKLITWSEAKRDDQALVVARVHGELDLLRQEPGVDGLRKWWAAWCWLVNRGTREIWDAYVARTAPRTLKFSQFRASAARAAEARCFDYDVHVGRILETRGKGEGLLREGDLLRGEKRLTYGLASNPWRQLTALKLTAYPAGLGAGVLKLDGRFLARQGFPLIRITRQENQMVALAELASWAACWVRMLASIHLWSFRAPDVAPVRAPQLLPAAAPRELSWAGRILAALTGRKRLPRPEIREIELEPPRQGVPVRLRLTRYPGKRKPPVVLIHGYSASGSTFTHEAIPKPLALYLHERGHDVWVLDLRTSAGMPSGQLPWHFEDAALADIPVAIAHIREATGAAEVDVFAHCIGAVMLGMALLTHPTELWKFDLVDPADGGPRPKRYGQELLALRGSIGRIVLSQKAPTLVYSDGNVLRAYFMRALRRVILPDDYQFTVPTEPKGVAGGLLDRVLSTMPYPDDEFWRENPSWWRRTPWAGFRHRMDALYARDFSLKNITRKTLASIHDLFGPLNLETVAQAIHFARFNTITDGAGRAIDTQAAVLAERWPRQGTLCIHGEENGLANVVTVDVFEAHLRRAGITPVIRTIENYGHQDCLIGRGADRNVFQHIARFLEEQRHDETESRREPSVPLADPVKRPGT